MVTCMKIPTIFSRIGFSKLKALPHLALALPLLLMGCSENTHEEKEYSAQVVRTEYGIPHITAHSWGSLGYGYGYAYSQDNFCVAMKEIVRANGESARYLGEDGSIGEDFVYKLYNTDDYIRDRYLADQDFADLIAGFTAGMNRYLDETGVDALAEGDEGCRGAEWVRRLNDTDLGKLLRKLMLRASTDALAEFISAQDGPDDPAVIAARSKAKKLPFEPQDWLLAGAGLEQLLPKPEELGSNAYAIGGNQTRNGLGLLLGNPHFPWQGTNRFYMAHLTIPGVYDVMGASLHGFPLVNIGFNRDIAWSHTVSTGRRFTLYELELDPDDPMKYVYGGELRDIETQTVSAERLLPSGEVETVEHTFYLSHYGPVIDLSEPAGFDFLAEWPIAGLGSVFAVRDANLYNSRSFQTWRGMGTATNVEEVLAAMANIGIPWVNTLAADREGNAFYADISTIPHVTQAQVDSCINGIVPPLLTDSGLFTLDGSDPACEWGNDGDSPEAGIFGFSSLPKIVTRDYVANANDSYWLSNPDHLLEGFSPIIGEEQVAQTLRTRLTFTQAEQRIAGTDGLGAPGFDVPTLQQLTLGNRNIAAEMVLDDVLTICNSVADWSSEALSNDYLAQNPAAMPQACSVLGAWDRLSTIDSVGPHVFQEFWFALVDPTDGDIDPLVEEEQLWAVAFDAAAPVTTPNTLNTGDADVVMAVKTALAMSVDSWLVEGIPLDRPWGQVQFSPRNGENIPIHGGSKKFSFSVITADRVEGEGYSDIRHGNSIIQTVGWDGSDCPDAFAILTYSQSTDPASPHYADMTRLYSAKGWVDVPFCDQDISAQQIGEVLDLVRD